MSKSESDKMVSDSYVSEVISYDSENSSMVSTYEDLTGEEELVH